MKRIKSHLKLLLAMGAGIVPTTLVLACNSPSENATRVLKYLQEKFQDLTTTSKSSKEFNELEISTKVEFNNEKLGLTLPSDLIIPEAIKIYMQKQAGNSVVTYTFEVEDQSQTLNVTFDQSSRDKTFIDAYLGAMQKINTTTLSGQAFVQLESNEVTLDESNASSLFGFSFPTTAIAARDGLIIKVSKIKDSLYLQYKLYYNFGFKDVVSGSARFYYSKADEENLKKLKEKLLTLNVTTIQGSAFMARSFKDLSLKIENLATNVGITFDEITTSDLAFRISKNSNSKILTYEINYIHDLSVPITFDVNFVKSTYDETKIDNLKQKLMQVKTTYLTSSAFNNEDLTGFNYLNDAETKLGMSFEPLDTSNVEVILNKPSGAMVLNYQVKAAMATTVNFSVTVDQFATDEIIGNILKSVSRTTSLTSDDFYKATLAITNYDSATIINTLGLQTGIQTLPNGLETLQLSKLANSLVVNYHFKLSGNSNVIQAALPLKNSTQDDQNLAAFKASLESIKVTTIVNFHPLSLYLNQVTKTEFSAKLGLDLSALNDDLQFTIDKAQFQNRLAFSITYGKLAKTVSGLITITSSTGDQAKVEELKLLIEAYKYAGRYSASEFDQLTFGKDAPVLFNPVTLGTTILNDKVQNILKNQGDIVIKMQKNTGSKIVTYTLTKLGDLIQSVVFAVTFDEFIV